MKNSGNVRDRLEVSINNLETARDALIREISNSQGKARLHANTLVSVCDSLKYLKEINTIKPSPKLGKKKPTVKGDK